MFTDAAYTILAPVDEAWKTQDVANLTAQQARGRHFDGNTCFYFMHALTLIKYGINVTEVFMSHVVEGSRYSSGLADGEEIDTLHNYQTIKVEVRNGNSHFVFNYIPSQPTGVFTISIYNYRYNYNSLLGR